MGEMTRQEQRREDCWAIEDLYAVDSDWENDFKKLSEEMQDFAGYQNRVTKDSKTLLEVLSEMDQLNCRFEKIYVYANQRYHEDTGNSKYQEFSARASRLEMELGHVMAFVEPELLNLSQETLELFVSRSRNWNYTEERFRNVCG